MLTPHLQTGTDGERAAAAFLQKAGYKILAQNWRHKQLEIDIIAMDGPILVFAEVKTRSRSDFGLPFESVTLQKQRKLERAANRYIRTARFEGEIRFDILSILINSDKTFNIRHIKDAFWPE